MTTKAASITDLANVREETPWMIVWRRFRKHKLAMVSAFVMLFIFLLSIFAQQLSPFKVDELKVGNYFLAPMTAAADGRVHYFGTDNLGRDMFSRLLFAGRISLSVALISVLISEVIGITVGAIAGFFGGWTDAISMRFVEFLLTIPSLPLLLILSSMLIRNPEIIPVPDALLNLLGQVMLLRPSDARQAVVIIIVLSGLGWLSSAQLMRGMILSLREQTFVEASRSLGASPLRIILLHMIPNAMAPIIVEASLALGGYVVTEASLSFLGFGIQDPIPTWGNMLFATQQFMLDRPYLPLIPGMPIFICSLAFNYIGDGLRDALDPRLKM